MQDILPIFFDAIPEIFVALTHEFGPWKIWQCTRKPEVL